MTVRMKIIKFRKVYIAIPTGKLAVGVGFGNIMSEALVSRLTYHYISDICLWECGVVDTDSTVCLTTQGI